MVRKEWRCISTIKCIAPFNGIPIIDGSNWDGDVLSKYGDSDDLASLNESST